MQASGSEPVLSFVSPDESTGGVGEPDGSKKGKEKEGAKVSWEERGGRKERGRRGKGLREREVKGDLT